MDPRCPTHAGLVIKNAKQPDFHMDVRPAMTFCQVVGVIRRRYGRDMGFGRCIQERSSTNPNRRDATFATTRSESNFIRAPAGCAQQKYDGVPSGHADNEMTIASDLLQQ